MEIRYHGGRSVTKYATFSSRPYTASLETGYYDGPHRSVGLLHRLTEYISGLSIPVDQCFLSISPKKKKKKKKNKAKTKNSNSLCHNCPTHLRCKCLTHLSHKCPTHLSHKCPTHLNHKCPIPISHPIYLHTSICVKFSS